MRSAVSLFVVPAKAEIKPEANGTDAANTLNVLYQWQITVWLSKN